MRGFLIVGLGLAAGLIGFSGSGQAQPNPAGAFRPAIHAVTQSIEPAAYRHRPRHRRPPPRRRYDRR